MWPYLFVAMDICVAACLLQISAYRNLQIDRVVWPEPIYQDEFNAESTATTYHCANYVKDGVDSSKPIDYYIDPQDMATLYLLNPLTMISCIAQSTQIFTNLAVFLSILFAIRGKIVSSVFFNGIAAYLSLYPIVYIAPCVLFLSRQCKISVWYKLIIGK